MIQICVLQDKDKPEGEGDDESEEGDKEEQPATIGSLGAQYGGAYELFYSQFELHTRQQKRNQIVLLQVRNRNSYSCLLIGQNG